MDGFKLPYNIQNWCTGKILEAARVRHCVVGDLIIVALSQPVVPRDVLFAVADEQIDAARSALASHGYEELPQTRAGLFDNRATKESQTGWPGYLFIPKNASPSTTGTLIMSATFWHLDLSYNSWEKNTFLLPNTPCRFPRKLFYLQAIIDTMAERYEDKELNSSITGYLKWHYLLVLESAKDVIPSLSNADHFFVDLFDKVMLPSAKLKVCQQRRRIREGSITREAAESLIPRKDLQLAAIKRKYQASPADPAVEG